MGWSHSKEAGQTMEAWTAACQGQTGSQNSYTGTDGRSYFWETSRKEHDDGGVTGLTYQDLGDTCRASGPFRIAGDGDVVRYPKAWPFPKHPAPQKCHSCNMQARLVIDTADNNPLNGRVYCGRHVPSYTRCTLLPR